MCITGKESTDQSDNVTVSSEVDKPKTSKN
jgi:hypothetical protein